jgi:YebC/PmpR family DNA-binding regulatory protein
MKLNLQLFGRAYEVRKASIQKTGAAKAKLYSMYAREIYDVAKKGGADPDSNLSLRRLLEKAKKEQVPGDIIKRALDKVNSGADESYITVRYEIFGPSGSTAIVECLTDNVNRAISSVKTALNKCKSKMGVEGSVSFNYDHLCIVGFKGLSMEEALEATLEEGIEISDIEEYDGMVIIYGNPQDFIAIKEAIYKKMPNVEFEIDEITMLAKEKITLSKEDLEIFNRLISMLEEAEDTKCIYHNVIL